MNEISIRYAADEDQIQWDQYVQLHTDAWPYHLFAWKQSIEKAYGFHGNYLVAERNKCIVGLLPLIKMGMPFCSKSLVALPYCDVGGILSDDNDVRELLLRKAISYSVEGAKYVEIRDNINDTLLDRLSVPFCKVTEKVRMLLNLPGSSEELWNGFKSKLRSQVRKAEKNGLSFTFSPNIKDFYAVFSENMRDLGSPVHSRSWIESILHFYGEKARMGLVYYDKRPVGAGVILVCGKKVSIPWASTLLRYNRLNPNMLLYWKFLQFAADNGFEIFDFGRSSLDEGTFRFKVQWGATPLPLLWHKIFLKGTTIQKATGSAKIRKHMASIWQKLPLKLANSLGPKLRKYISL